MIDELANVGTRDLNLPGSGGDVPVRIYRHPTERRDAALVWVHGGGFGAGDLDMPEADWTSRALAARGFAVLSVDYRKCVGGVHYPAPSDDVLTAWLWATEHIDELGVSAEHLHLGGASAGASLSAGVTKRLRDGAGPVPASVVLVYPTLHPRLPEMSEHVLAATEVVRTAMPNATDMLDAMNLNYSGSEEVLDDPYAFPALGDVGRLPPVYILNSENDMLRASGEAHAADLAEAGVSVTVEYEPGVRHGHLNEPSNPGAARSVDRVAEWLAARN